MFPFHDISENTTNIVLSPVYSTADEDLTQCLEIDDNIGLGEQIHDGRTDSDKNKEKIETKGGEADSNTTEGGIKYKNVTTLNNQTQLIEKGPLSNDMEVIDLCNGEINVPISQNNALRFHHELDYNIQNAISNLSLRDIDTAFTPFSQECSQSILGGYYPAYTQYSVQKEVALPLTINDVIKIAPHQQPETETISKDVLPKILLATTKRKINVQTPAGNKPVATQKSVKTSKQETKKRNNAKNKTDIKTSKQSDTKVANEKKTQKQKNVKANDTKHKQNEANRSNTTQTANKQSNHQYQSYTNKLTYSKTQQSIEPRTDKCFKANKGKDRQIVPIHNKAVANDLSWIENIRFVREIPSEEYESFIQEAFWENYTLPDDWNDNDFNYK